MNNMESVCELVGRHNFDIGFDRWYNGRLIIRVYCLRCDNKTIFLLGSFREAWKYYQEVK